MPDDAARVRQVLARELETISHYEALAQEASAPEVRAFLLHLAAEEKEHVAEATVVLNGLDPTQAEYFRTPVAAGHFKAPRAGTERPTEPHDPLAADPRRMLYALPAPLGVSESGFTVGDLKRRTP